MTLPAPAPLDTKTPNKVYRKNFRWWHESIIDDMILHPRSGIVERAQRLGYAPAYLSTLMNSDMFRAVYAERRAHLRSVVDDSIAQKMGEVADLGLTVMKEKLEQKRTSIAFADLVKMNEGLLDRLGYGVKSGPATAVQVNVNTPSAGVTQESLAAAREQLRAIEAARAAATEPKVIEAPQGAAGASASHVFDAGDLGGSSVVDVTPNPDERG